MARLAAVRARHVQLPRQQGYVRLVRQVARAIYRYLSRGSEGQSPLLPSQSSTVGRATFATHLTAQNIEGINFLVERLYSG